MNHDQQFRVREDAQKLATAIHSFADSLSAGRSAELQRQMRQAATSLHKHLALERMEGSGEKLPTSVTDSVNSINELETLFFLAKRTNGANTARVQPILSQLSIVKKRVIAMRKDLVATK